MRAIPRAPALALALLALAPGRAASPLGPTGAGDSLFAAQAALRSIDPDDSFFAVQAAFGRATSSPTAESLVAFSRREGVEAAVDEASEESVDMDEASEESAAVGAAMASAEAAALASNERFPLKIAPETSPSLSKKFYVYKDIEWLDMKCNGIPINRTVKFERDRKHTDDYWFLKAAMDSPWRTMDPEEAELFVVPSLLNAVSETMAFSKGTNCCVGQLCGKDLFEHVEGVLKTSPWFKRKEGRDHVIVCSHYQCPFRTKHFNRISQCNHVSFEENSMRDNRCRIASTYVGRWCRPQRRRYGMAMVASLHLERPGFHERRDACKWLAEASQEHPNLYYNFSWCGEGEQCPALAQARFGLHVKGDTYGSQRPMDAILSGTVPLFTNNEQYRILPPFVPWRNITAIADLATKSRFIGSLALAQKHYGELQKAVETHMFLVNWQTKVPFEKYMGLFQRCAR